jgi:hypothetical protein
MQTHHALFQSNTDEELTHALDDALRRLPELPMADDEMEMEEPIEYEFLDDFDMCECVNV